MTAPTLPGLSPFVGPTVSFTAGAYSCAPPTCLDEDCAEDVNGDVCEEGHDQRPLSAARKVPGIGVRIGRVGVVVHGNGRIA